MQHYTFVVSVIGQKYLGEIAKYREKSLEYRMGRVVKVSRESTWCVREVFYRKRWIGLGRRCG